MDKLLTISVAAYNVEQYLDQLMESIVAAEVMDALEVLIVNDGSKDGTARKAMEYQNRYPDSVRLVDKENGGHGSTINTGISLATGKYFRALDGDDWLHSAHLGALVRRMEQIDADLILSDYRFFYEGGKELMKDVAPALRDSSLYSFEEFAAHVMVMQYHAVIFRTSILKEQHIRLDEHCFYVDTEFVLFTVPYLNTVYFAKDYIYCYRLGREGQSMTAASRRKNIANMYTVSQRLLEYYREKDSVFAPSQRAFYLRGLANQILGHMRSLMLFPASAEKKEELIALDNHIKQQAPECYREMLNKGKDSRMIRVLRMSGYHAYWLICTYKKYKRKLEGDE